MRKLKLQVQISVDGFVARKNGELDWTTRLDDRCWLLLHEMVDSSDTLLLGRKMAEDFVPHFETFASADKIYEFARKMVNIPKVIFTKTLTDAPRSNITLAKGELADEMHKLKNRAGGDILVYGGAGLVSALLAGGHIDELILFVNPVLLHDGIRIFDLLPAEQPLALVSATAYECGVSVLHYRLVNG